MTKYRYHLPQLDGGLFLTGAGIETTLIFQDGLDLPYFAAFHLLNSREGTEALHRYYTRHINIARQQGHGFILESATWRSSSDWGEKIGYSPADLDALNRKSIILLSELRDEFETADSPMVISGCVGPRGDGYDPGALMTPQEAQAYHARQIGVFAETLADQVTAITMTNADEATGVAQAAARAGIPSVISFTVETDGRLPTGQALRDAIAQVDDATSGAPVYYMINCAHPDHFADKLEDDDWASRIRANASRSSHAELDEAEELDDGDPVELGTQYAALRRRMPWINVLGGCCGTDHRHIREIARACTDASLAA